MQRLKRKSFALWRDEEKALGFTLSPEFFQLRNREDLPWRPKNWRAEIEVREQWVDTLRGRIEQEQSIFKAAQMAAQVVEERLLGELRNELIRITVLPGVITREKLIALTQRLAIDCEAGTCQITTRIAQAIETIQGVLFGARHGLLEGNVFSLDAPNFDEEWQWIGAYASWRAAMQVFLYPENALRPILRREKSKAFQKLITDLQKTVPVSPADAQKAADRYSQYFDDICTLTPVAVHETGNWQGTNSTTGTAGRGCLVVARGRSGKLYFAAFDHLPAWYLSFVPDHTMWEEIEGLPLDSEVVGFLPYQPSLGEVHIGLYLRHRRDDAQALYFASFDGIRWNAPKPIADFPDLVTAAEYRDGVIPADPALAAAGSSGWQLNGNDRLIPMYVEGFGSTNSTAIMVVAAQNESDGRRRVGVLRGRDGGLVLTAFTTIDGGWNLPPGKPILLWRGGVQRLLLTMQDNALTQLGLLGTNWPQNNSLALVWQTNDGFVRAPDGTAWQVRANVPLVAVALDNIYHTSLLAIEFESTTDRFGFSAYSTRIFPLRPSGQGFQLQASFLLNNRHHEGTNMCSSLTHVAARRFVPVRLTSFETLLVIGEHWHRYTGGGNCTISVYARIFAWDAIWNGQSGRLDTRGLVPETNLDPPSIALGTDNELLPIQLPNGNEGALLLPGTSPLLPTGTSRRDLAVVAYDASNRLRVTWQTIGAAIDPSTQSAVGAWSIRQDDSFQALGIDGKRQLIVARADGSEISGLDVLDNAGKLGVGWRINNRVYIPGGTSGQGWPITPNAFYTGIDLDRDGAQEVLALSPDGRLGVLHTISSVSSGQGASEQGASDPLRNIGPTGVSVTDIINRSSQRWLPDRIGKIETAYSRNGSSSLRRYLDEAYFFVPIQIALRLRESGHYTAALDWLRSIYDYEAPIAERKIAYRLVIDEHPYEPEVVFQRDPNWLADPVNPHAIAETRKYSYIKFTILNIVRCLLDFADAEFTRATSESVPRARELYLEALELLNLPEISQHLTGCSERIGELPLRIGEDEYEWIWQDILNRLGAITQIATLTSTIERIKAVIRTDEQLARRLTTVRKIVDEVQPEDTQKTYSTIASQKRAIRQRAQSALLADQATSTIVRRLGRIPIGSNGSGDIRKGSSAKVSRASPDARSRGASRETYQVDRRATSEHATTQMGGAVAFAELPKYPAGYWKEIPAPSFGFCIPPNEVTQAARSHAELNLNKIRTCRNIAGLEMQLDPYTMPTAAEASLHNLGSADRLPTLQRPSLQPLPYRYSTLIERTKQLVELARQIEASMLSSLQSLDQEQYQVLKARHDLALTEAGVRLKDLQLAEANDNIRAAELQRERARLQFNNYRRLLAQGLSTMEVAALGAMTTAVAAEFAGIYSPETFLEWFGAAAPALGRLAELSTSVASYERRAEEWRFQRDIATQDIQIGQQQVQLAFDRLRISAQDRAIAALQSEQAKAMLDFIDTQKFGDAALYEWMIGVLEQVYRFFLQQATSIARLAEAQLAFERQEIPPAFIQADYWEPPSNTNPPSVANTDAQAANVHGLTGSARLLRDIYELDQYAFQTNQRKLQLTEMISLAQLDPIAFQRFRETGVLPFAMPMSLFDRKFPGHYLRLILRVKTSVIALIPPMQGIRATLATTGTSRVVIGGNTFQAVRLQRGPESVALTAPMNATGLFELDVQPETIVPFEGIGVDTAWEFRLPKAANPFDYNTIADVLIAIDYTALNDFGYAQRVIKRLDNRVIADRPFSFRRDFSDAWWDLHNPDQTPTPLEVSFETARADFPGNIERLSIQEVVVFFAFAPGKTVAIDPVTFSFTPMVEPPAPAPAPFPRTPGGVINGVISTRAGQLVGLNKTNKPVSGLWTLSFQPADNDAAKRERATQLFRGEKLQDMLLVITYSGTLPAWPA